MSYHFTEDEFFECLPTDPQAVVAFVCGPHGGGSANRARLVADWADLIVDGPAFWKVVQEVWSGFDRIPHDDFAEQFARFADSLPPCDVPDRMTVYRGQSADAQKGLSWTLDRQVAVGFAHGHRGMINTNPVVLQREVTRDQVAFVCNGRDEQEVILKVIPD